MPPPKKKKLDDKEQTSLFSFVSDKEQKKGKSPEKPKVEELEKDKKRKPKVKSKSIKKKKIKESPKKVEKSTKEIPPNLFFQGNNELFGLKEGNIKLTKILRENVSSKYIRYLIEKGEIVEDMERGILLDVDYDGGQNKAYCKFYDLKTDEIKIWIDTTDHEPYCLSKEKIIDLQNMGDLTDYEGFTRFEEIKKVDLLKDKKISITKIYGKTPSDIGGSGTNIRNILGKNNKKAWEADIRYHLNYIFDRQLIPGLIYTIKGGQLKKLSFEEDSEETQKMAKELRDQFKDESSEIQEFSEKFLDIFLTPIPNVKRLAMDIEVNLGSEDFIIPDPRLAKQAIISISFVASDGLKLVYVLEREEFVYSGLHKKFPSDAEIVFFRSEKKLLIETFRLLWEYPVIITFNGDNFDLNYMFHRANKLKIDKNLNPIHIKRGFGFLSRSDCDLRKGIHIDLFNFFFNRSISGYAFGGAYESSSLNAISNALLGEMKYEHEEEIHEMEYDILTWYNLKDSILTLELTTFNNSLVWNLIVLLCRITKMPIHETVRRQISTWIQNIFYFEHRRKNYLIPRRSEIAELKTGGYSKAVIEGKTFAGAYVVPPVPGIHFDVVVMDFASLYPSIIKEYNLSYETVLCPHKDDENNLVKGTPYHICTQKMGIFAYVVGFFRDIRVKYFKPKSSDKNLTEKQRSYYHTIQQALKVFVNGCLPYDEEVIIKNENDQILKVKIGDLENNWEGKQILSIERDSESFGRKKFVKIIGVIKRNDNEYIEITLSDGRKLQCTKDHIIPKIVDLKNISEVEAKNLKIEDELLVLHDNYLNNDPPKTIFIPNLIPLKNLWISIDREEYKKYSYRISESTINPVINLINSKFKYSKVSKIYKCLWDELDLTEKKLIENKSSHFKFSVKYGEESGRWNHILLDLPDEFFAFLGWYIAEGSIDKNRVTISQKREIHPLRYKHIISLIQSLNFPFSSDNKKIIRVNSNILKEVIVSLCSEGAGNKKIPLELLNSSRALTLLKNYYLGDGNLKKGKWKRYSTKSQQLKNDLVYLLGALGKYCSIVNPKNAKDIFRIVNTEGRKYRRKFFGLVDFNGTIPVRIKNIKIIKKNIDVYDIETGNGWFVATNGIIVHNCYGVFGSQNFPLFCLPVAESTTSIGQYSIKQTIKKSEELGVKVLYGDSIVGTRCIAIKEDNQINVIPIEELWNNCCEPIEKIGEKEVKTPQSIFTLSKNGDWQKIKKIIRHKTNKKIYRINQKNGETICTEDHSLITENYESVKPQELGDKKILFLEKIHHHQPTLLDEKIDLYPLVRHYSFETEYKNRKKQNTWKVNDNFLWFGWTTRKDQQKINRFCNLSDLCKLLGIYIADGHSSIHKGKYGYKAAAGISSYDTSFLNEIKEIMERIDYNHKISILRTTKKERVVQGYKYEDKTYRLQTNSTTWTAFFSSLCGSGSENKYLPQFIFNVEKKYQELLYKYYLLGEGCVEQGKNTFTTKSLQLVSGLCYLLKSWNLDTSIYYYDKRDVYRIRERERAVDSMHPIKTKQIELPRVKRYVYDLSVENTEIFADACGMLLLHNTDSVFLLNPSNQQMKEISEWSKKELDLDLEEEKTYQFLALSERKKNYVGIYKDTKYVDIKGLVAKKKNTPDFIKKVFSEMIEILKNITTNEQFLKAKDNIIEIIRSNLKKIGKPDAFTLEDYAINISIQKNLKDYTKVVPQHVRAALELKEITGKEFQKGETISFIKSKGNIGAKALELAKLQDVDTKKYKELLMSALEQVLDALGITYEEIKGIKKMDAFF